MKSIYSLCFALLLGLAFAQTPTTTNPATDSPTRPVPGIRGGSGRGENRHHFLKFGGQVVVLGLILYGVYKCGYRRGRRMALTGASTTQSSYFQLPAACPCSRQQVHTAPITATALPIQTYPIQTHPAGTVVLTGTPVV